MSRAGQFTEGDITRLGKGLRKAGFNVVHIEIRPTGEIVAIGKEGMENVATDHASGWDEQLAEEEQPTQKRH